MTKETTKKFVVGIFVTVAVIVIGAIVSLRNAGMSEGENSGARVQTASRPLGEILPSVTLDNEAALLVTQQLGASLNAIAQSLTQQNKTLEEMLKFQREQSTLNTNVDTELKKLGSELTTARGQLQQLQSRSSTIDPKTLEQQIKQVLESYPALQQLLKDNKTLSDKVSALEKEIAQITAALAKKADSEIVAKSGDSTVGAAVPQPPAAPADTTKEVPARVGLLLNSWDKTTDPKERLGILIEACKGKGFDEIWQDDKKNVTMINQIRRRNLSQADAAKIVETCDPAGLEGRSIVAGGPKAASEVTCRLGQKPMGRYGCVDWP